MLFLHPLLLLLSFSEFFSRHKNHQFCTTQEQAMNFFSRDDFLTTWNPHKLLRGRISKQSFISLNPTKKFVKPLP
jgi:hypothetical protein